MEDEEEEDDFRVVLLRFFGRGLAELSRGRAAVQLPSDVMIDLLYLSLSRLR